MEKILLELLQEDRTLLLRNKDLIEELEKRIAPSARRKFSSLKMALENNIGAIFENEPDVSAAALEAKKILSEIGMDDDKADSVIKIFENVLGELDTNSEPEPEPELPKVELSKPQPPKIEPQKIPPPNVEPPKVEPQKSPPPKVEPPPQKSESEKKSSWKNFLIGALVLLLIFSFFSSGSDKKETSPPATESQTTTQTQPAETQSPQNSSATTNEQSLDENTKQAAITFINYHRAISRKDFLTAYNLMDREQQSRMGPTLRDFESGYTDTIFSEITNLELVSTSDSFVVMDYVLDARDKDPRGTLYQQFKGQVTIQKVDGEWKIHSTLSKKINEVIEH